MDTNKKNILNTIYSSKLLISKFFEFLYLDCIISNIEYDKSVNINHNNKSYLVYPLKISSRLFINNLITKNLLNQIEHFYEINENYLSLSNIFIISKCIEKTDNVKIELTKFTCQFIMLINISDVEQEDIIKFDVMPDFKINLQPNKSIVFCNNLSYTINNTNNILAICINVLDGYNKIENHNRHPNMNK